MLHSVKCKTAVPHTAAGQAHWEGTVSKRILPVTVAFGLAAGLALLGQDNFKNGQDLTGTWRISVTIPPGSSACPSGSSPCTFLALATAMSDGTVIQTAALPGTSIGHGVWQRTGLRHFTVRSTYFRLDAAGFAIGTAETVTAIELDHTGLQASGTYANTLLTLEGQPVGGFTASTTATRVVP